VNSSVLIKATVVITGKVSLVQSAVFAMHASGRYFKGIAIGLAIATLLNAGRQLFHRSSHSGWIIALLFGAPIGLFATHLATSVSPSEPRLFALAIALIYLATGLAFLLIRFNLVLPAIAFPLAFTIGIALLNRGHRSSQHGHPDLGSRQLSLRRQLRRPAVRPPIGCTPQRIRTCRGGTRTTELFRSACDLSRNKPRGLARPAARMHMDMSISKSSVRVGNKLILRHTWVTI